MTKEPLVFNYILEEAGWATLKIKLDEIVIEHDISYLHNSLKELIDTTNLLLQQRSKQVRIVFMSEPGELQIVLMKQPDDSLNLEARRFDDWNSWGMLPNDEYDVLLQTNINLIDWANIVLENVEKLYVENGEELYKQKWVSEEFPMFEYMLLKKL